MSTHSGIEDTDGMIVVSLLRIITWIYCAKPANTVGQMTEMKLFLAGGAKMVPWKVTRGPVRENESFVWYREVFISFNVMMQSMERS